MGEETRARPRVRGYVAWGLVGACAGFGVVALLTIGIVFVVLAVLVAGFLAARRIRGVTAVFVGLAAAPGFVAVINRSGPGTVCRTSGHVESCVEQLNPWPWAAVALVMVVVALALVALGRAGRGL